MEKKLIEDKIFDHQSENPIPFKVIKDYVQDDDIIYSEYREADSGSSWSHDGYYYIKVTRERLETDQEFERRKFQAQEFKDELKRRRYETYLKFKKEFEP